MYICDRLAERERVILVTIFVAIRYRVSTVWYRTGTSYMKYPLFLKTMYQVPTVPWYGVPGARYV